MKACQRLHGLIYELWQKWLSEVPEIGIKAALSAIKPGMTEAEVCAEGIKAGIAAGADFIRNLRGLSNPFSGWPHRWPLTTERFW